MRDRRSDGEAAEFAEPGTGGAGARRTVHRLEVRTEALADAVRLLARGLEAGPMAEPAAGRSAEAARRAHELLLAVESAPPVDPGASKAHPGG